MFEKKKMKSEGLLFKEDVEKPLTIYTRKDNGCRYLLLKSVSSFKYP